MREHLLGYRKTGRKYRNINQERSPYRAFLFFRYSDGTVFVTVLKTRLKLLTEPKPHLKQISATDKPSSVRSFLAFSIFTVFRYCVNVFPVAFLNNPLKYSGV